MTALALKYRPQTFGDVAGQRAVRAVLSAMLRADDVPTGLLFVGDRGTGKTTMGRILAAALNCDAESRPCGQCASCVAVFNGTSLDVLEIDAASHGTAADVRRLMDSIRYTTGGTYRVVLLDEAHALSNAAFTAILKDLEEPPPNTVFVLLTTEPHKILGTVLSRLMSFEFTPLSASDVVGRLEFIAHAEGIDATPDLLVAIADRAQGGMRDAVMLLDHASRVGVSTAEQLMVLVGATDVAPLIVAALAAGDLPTAYRVVDEELSRSGDAQIVSARLIGVCKDLLVLSGQGTLPYTGAPLQARLDLAHIPTARVFKCMRVLWELKTRVKVHDAPRESLYLAVAMMASALADPATPVADTSAQKLTLADMQAMT